MRLKDKWTFYAVSSVTIDEIVLFRMFPAERAKQEGLSYEGTEKLLSVCLCSGWSRKSQAVFSLPNVYYYSQPLTSEKN